MPYPRQRVAAAVTWPECPVLTSPGRAPGPFRRWEHRHEFEAALRDGRAGTLVRDVLEYDLGFGLLGRLAQRLFVGARLRRTFERRQRTLEKLLRAG